MNECALLQVLPGLVLLCICTGPAAAHDGRTADLPTITESILVTGERPDRAVLAIDTQFEISESSVQDLDAVTVDDVVRLLPGAYVPTNSRGEAIIFFRNAGERQVTVLFDGAPINVPWDNRLDLSMFPAGLIGSARTAQGPLSPHYGVNAVGAVNLLPRTGPSERAEVILRLEAGGAQARLVEGAYGGRAGEFDIAIGGGFSHQDGEPLSDAAALPFFQSDPDLRTNTDRDIRDIYGRMQRNFGAGRAALTILYVDAEKGVAPESDRASGNRFWRYPDVSHFLAIGSTSLRVGDATSLDASAWFQEFSQTIDAFETNDYSAIDLRENEIDETYGARGLLFHNWGRNKLVLAINYLESLHRQSDFNFTGGLPPAAAPPELQYRQRNYSLGAEFERALTDDFVFDIAIGNDWVDYVETGDKPPINSVSELTARVGAIWRLSDEWSIRGSAGRKARAPTMRELFGQALNRFLINPGLKPETILTAELGLDWQIVNGAISVIPFVQDVKDTIDQRNVGPLRQRINLRGSHVTGIEITGWYAFLEGYEIDANLLYTDVDRKQSAPTDPTTIAEKPDLLAKLGVEYSHPQGIGLRVEAEHTGRAFSVGPTGAFVPLETSTQLNLRATYQFRPFASDQFVETYLRLDNVTDAYVEPQAGLPAPGRWARGGVRIAW